MPNDDAREQAVRADMESIFGPPKAWYAAHDGGIATRNTVRASVGRRRGTFGTRAIATAGAFLLLAAGVGFTSGGLHGLLPVPAGRAGPREVPVARQAASSVFPQPQLADAVTPRAVSQEVAPEAPRMQGTASRRTEAGFEVTAAAVDLPTKQALPRRPTATDTLPVRQRTRVAEIEPDRPCRLGEDQDRCIYQDVLSADARLRVAYAAAAREGAPVDELAAVRRRWIQAHDLSLERPDEAIRRYDDLADSLRADDGDRWR